MKGSKYSYYSIVSNKNLGQKIPSGSWHRPGKLGQN